MYQFVTGPLAWLSFAIFFIGLIVRIVLYYNGLDWKIHRVTRTENISRGIKGASRSVFLWPFSFGIGSWRKNPGFTILIFTFYVGLIVTPIFLLAHNIILKERWGLRFWTLQETATDILTIIVIVIGVFLILRSIALPQIRNITTVYDYVLLAVSVAPFITGFLAYHQVPDYKSWLIAHIICGEIMLMVIPFIKLWHVKGSGYNLDH